MDTLFRQSDVISLHCPLFKENYHLLDAQAFAKMKKGSTSSTPAAADY